MIKKGTRSNRSPSAWVQGTQANNYIFHKLKTRGCGVDLAARMFTAKQMYSNQNKCLLPLCNNLTNGLSFFFSSICSLHVNFGTPGMKIHVWRE